MRQPLHVAMLSCRRPGAIALLLMACGLLACGGSGARSDKTAALTATPEVVDEAGLRAFIDQQLRLARDGDWAGLYATYSPDAQAGCSREQFVAEREAQTRRGFDPAKVSQTIASIRADGDRAYITWSTTYAGTPIAASDANPDGYIRIDGRWFDAPDAHTGCASRAATTATGTPPAAGAPTSEARDKTPIP